MADHHELQALRTRVEQWLSEDPDATTRNELASLLTALDDDDVAQREAAVASLTDAFNGRLTFGTAGLRAKLGAGPRRMNRIVIAQSSAGLAAYLHARAARGECASTPTIIVGYDGRINSDVFAREAAEVFAGAGLEVTLMPHAAPTPLTAFAVAQQGYSAGVMITASHNPPTDNGYKIYLGDADRGSQIHSTPEAEIADLILRASEQHYAEIPRSTGFTIADGAIADAYVRETVASLQPIGASDSAATDSTAIAAQPQDEGAQHRPLITVYTAMHGVGSDLSMRVFAEAGLPAPHRVAVQDTPDGTFPTLPYPNPEEPGSLDLAIARATELGAQLIIAQDPDADRLGVVVPAPGSTSGNTTYRRLSGNELGLLLGWRAAEREVARAQHEGRAPRGALANTLVSTPALAAVAEAHGLEHVETLSGFKWVSRVPELVFGFEESLGYLSNPGVLRDKDGISAALEAYAMVAELHAEGRTVWDRLDEASERFGHFASRQIVLRLNSAAEVSAITAALRKEVPEEFAGVRVERLVDLSIPGTSAVPADVLSFELEGGSRVMIRPSGTEAKLKVYLDLCVREGTAAERRQAAKAALVPIEQAVRVTVERAQRTAAPA